MNLLDRDSELTKVYDYITVLCLMEHIQDPEEIVRKLKEHFTKGLIIAVPNVGFLPHRVRLLFGKFPVVNIFYHIHEHIRFWTVCDFKQWANFFGFEIIRIIPTTNGLWARIWPSLFSSTIIYILQKKDKVVSKIINDNRTLLRTH